MILNKKTKILILSICLIILSVIFYAQQKHNRQAHIQQVDIPLFPIQKNGKLGYIDKIGKIIIEPQFNDVSDFSDGLAIITVSEYHYEWKLPRLKNMQHKQLGSK